MSLPEAIVETIPTMPSLPSVTKPEGARVPLKSWAVDVEQGALDQALNLTRLPFALSHVALMPDAHPGYGMPIGGVLFADRAIVPYAVGVDIGCGVSLSSTGLHAEDLDGDKVQAMLDAIAEVVPVGNGPDGGHKDKVVVPYNYSVYGGETSRVATEAIGAAQKQLGSLGGGNHFVELQAVEDGEVFSAGEVVFMIHSGSRSVGKKICDHWHKVATKMNERWHSQVPHPELAYLPWDSDEGQGYYTDMREGLNWAAVNRVRMRDAVEDALKGFGADVTHVVDVHHNYASMEHHFGKNGVVHRKGAVRARKSEVVLIPGSMGTRSYVGEGLGNEQSFESCQHGAGRARSRGATIRSQTEEEFLASVSHVKLGGKAAGARDESPYAYKDVERVVAASVDLVRPIATLRPLGVVKG